MDRQVNRWTDERVTVQQVKEYISKEKSTVRKEPRNWGVVMEKNK